MNISFLLCNLAQLLKMILLSQTAATRKSCKNKAPFGILSPCKISFENFKVASKLEQSSQIDAVDEKNSHFEVLKLHNSNHESKANINTELVSSFLKVSERRTYPIQVLLDQLFLSLFSENVKIHNQRAITPLW